MQELHADCTVAERGKCMSFNNICKGGLAWVLCSADLNSSLLVFLLLSRVAEQRDGVVAALESKSHAVQGERA